MFLKRIELQGFKSFADKAVLNFDQDVTGIVGPNGCGKSNVNDAIRWVLGEQSAKSLRGSNMSDVIFSGSELRKPVNLAKVTLVFDNSNRVFDIDFDEVEISRQLSRNGNEAGYFINQSPCRLKDISDLVMDTGLGKDSLSIITQGNISSFADARPEERRLLFEEAAGVAKYKKRKKVSLAKLENTKANLDRLQDIIDELEKRIEPLKEQAEKAARYQKLYDELKDIEISVLVHEIENCQRQVQALEADIAGQRIELDQKNGQIEELDTSISTLRKQMYGLDGQISAAQMEYTVAMEKKMALEKQKIELDEKRKYQLTLADSKAKAASLKQMLAEAKFDYENRLERLAKLKSELDEISRKTAALNMEIMQASAAREKAQSQVMQMKNRRSFLEQSLAQPFASQQGIRALKQAGDSIQGMEGVVFELLKAKPGMANAISSALGGSLYNMVTANEKAARQAIYYLKKNRAGRATFIPLSVIKPRTISPQLKASASKIEGYIGVASELVDCDPAFKNLKENLLGNIVVCQSLEHASQIARVLKYSVKVVTKDGEVVHAGGTMSGGSLKNQNSPLAFQDQLETLNKQLQGEEVSLQRLFAKESRLHEQADKLSQQQTSLRIEEGKLDNIVTVKKDKADSLSLQLSQLNVEAEDGSDDSGLELVSRLADIQQEIDETAAKLSLLRTRRLETGSECENRENLQRELRRALSALNSSVHKAEMQCVEAKTRMDADLMRLNTEYSMTFEFAQPLKKDMDFKAARNTAKTLRKEIRVLGSVNMAAPEEYEEVKTRYEFLSSQKQELLDAGADIKNSIEEMDKTMSAQFTQMFEKINEQLQPVFESMFGGGKARLFMVDPGDVLNTGIDIEVQPPGKMVKNLQAFSGGEKALIAISVLFAILKARTIPLCIFDEVEAALDQANVERFARYLSNFRNDSQFIVVTHRPGTMEQCDALYGVTMEQNGVSTLLKVQLKDAVHFSESEVKA